MHTKKFSINKLILYLIIAYGFTWMLWIPMALESQGNLNAGLKFLADLGSFGAWGPLIGAVIASIIFGGFKGIKELFKRTFIWKFSLKWWLVTLFILPIIIGLPLLITSISGAQYTFPEEFYMPLILPIVFIVVLLTTGPLQEEYGWRGTVYEELIKKINPLYASIMTGIAWAFWHIPQFFIAGNGMYYERPFWGLLVSTVLVSIIIAWVYNKTNRSMLVALIMHATFNFSHYIFPILDNDTAGLLYFFFLIVTVGFVIWKDGLKLGLE